MIKAGSQIKINMEVVRELADSFTSTEDQKNAYEFIQEHPDEIYIVKSVDTASGFLLQDCIHIDHLIIGKTTFFEDELILVNS